LKGDLAGLKLLTSKFEASSSEEIAIWFEDLMINRRNNIMFDGIVKHLEHGRAFIAVGALHLVGESGLLKMLENSGYQLNSI
jgi:uncharacterized protein YbaP (TraB family)